MVLRLIQLIASVFLLGVAALHFAELENQRFLLETAGPFFADHWQPVYFGLIAVATAWLFYVTGSLRPVVAIFAAVAFFLVAKMEDPSAASFKTALDGLTETVLTGIDTFREG